MYNCVVTFYTGSLPNNLIKDIWWWWKIWLVDYQTQKFGKLVFRAFCKLERRFQWDLYLDYSEMESDRNCWDSLTDIVIPLIPLIYQKYGKSIYLGSQTDPKCFVLFFCEKKYKSTWKMFTQRWRTNVYRITKAPLCSYPSTFSGIQLQRK